MSEDSGFQFTDDAVPRAYDEILVPRLFEPWGCSCSMPPISVETRSFLTSRPTSHARCSVWRARNRLGRHLHRVPRGTFGS